MLNYLIVIIFAYLIGSFPVHWVGKQKRVYSYTAPSFHHVFHKELLLLVLLDVGKGMFATLLGLSIAGWLGACLAAIAVVVGSMYSCFLQFRGGKGLAVSAGAVFILSPILILLGVLLYCFFLLTTRYLFLSNLLTIIAVIVLGIVFVTQLYVWFLILCLGIILIFHQKPDWKRFRRRWKLPFRFRNPFRSI